MSVGILPSEIVLEDDFGIPCAWARDDSPALHPSGHLRSVVGARRPRAGADTRAVRCERRLAASVLALAVLMLAPLSRAADPPNPNDPCSPGGRNMCGTLGVGFYEHVPLRLRWFGDFRGAVPGRAYTFCIDLGYWYPRRALPLPRVGRAAP